MATAGCFAMIGPSITTVVVERAFGGRYYSETRRGRERWLNCLATHAPRASRSLFHESENRINSLAVQHPAPIARLVPPRRSRRREQGDFSPGGGDTPV